MSCRQIERSGRGGGKCPKCGEKPTTNKVHLVGVYKPVAYCNRCCPECKIKQAEDKRRGDETLRKIEQTTRGYEKQAAQPKPEPLSEFQKLRQEVAANKQEIDALKSNFAAFVASAGSRR